VNGRSGTGTAYRLCKLVVIDLRFVSDAADKVSRQSEPFEGYSIFVVTKITFLHPKSWSL